MESKGGVLRIILSSLTLSLVLTQNVTTNIEESTTESNQVSTIPKVSKIDVNDYAEYPTKQDELLVTHRVFLDISVNGDDVPNKLAGTKRVVIGLFGSVVPQTVENFLRLARGENASGIFHGYAGSSIHRKTLWYLQGGAFQTGSHRWGQSLMEDDSWIDENHDIKHVGPGWLSMANVGQYSGSQFCISMRKNSWLDGKDVVFGKILEGMDAIYAISDLPDDENKRPEHDINIIASGELDTSPFYTAIEGVYDYSRFEVKNNELLVTHQVYLNVTFDGHPSAPIVIGLFGSVTPKTVQNFIALSRGEWRDVPGTDERLFFGYNESSFHRISYSYTQGGGFDTGVNGYGASLMDENVDWWDENHIIKHNGPGWVFMANLGSYSGSQFCISTRNTSYLNGKDTVFGKVISGMDTVIRIKATPREDNKPKHATIRITGAGVLPTVPFTTTKQPAQPENQDSLVTRLAYFDVTMGGLYTGRITFGLFDLLTPVTSENFAQLCTGKPGFGFVNTTMFRVIDNFMLQGGYRGTPGSIYGNRFNDENFVIKNRGAGWLGMANAGPDTNGGQYYITTVWTQWLDYKHVIFGKVLSGMDVVRKIEKTPVDANVRHKPYADVTVVGCNVIDLTPDQQFLVDKDPLNCEL